MIFLTGATGFLGSYILLDLLEKGHRVRALRRPGSSMEHVERVFGLFSAGPDRLLQQAEWVTGDILDTDTLLETMPGCDTVLHAAGLVSFAAADKKQLMTVNVQGTANVVNAALHLGIPRLVYVSSIAAMGRGGDDAVITEQTVWKNSWLNSAYAVSKYGGEKEVWRGFEEGLSVAVVNPSIILGYGEVGQAFTRMFETVRGGLLFYPAGTNGFVDVRDVATACRLLAESQVSGEKFILNVANLTYRELFSRIAAVLDKKPPRFRASARMTGIAWRMESVRCFFTRKEPLLTRETARTATQHYFYDGGKALSLPGFAYTPLEETIGKAALVIIREHRW